MGKDRLVKKLELTHGVILAGKVGGRVAYRGARELVQPYTFRLLQETHGISEVTLNVATLGEVIKASNVARKEFQPGTTGFNHAVARSLLRSRSQEELSEDFFDDLAGSDYDELILIAERGIDPHTGRTLFPVDPEKAEAVEGYTRTAFVRLHTNRDRGNAEFNTRTDRNEDPIGFQSQLALLVTAFGDDPDFSVRGDIHSLHSVSWPDFQAITSAIFGRDYEPLAEVLQGDVEVGGEKLPFPGVPEETDSPDKGKGSGKKSKGK